MLVSDTECIGAGDTNSKFHAADSEIVCGLGLSDSLIDHLGIHGSIVDYSTRLHSLESVSR